MACASETHLKSTHTFTRELRGGHTIELEQDKEFDGDDDDGEEKWE